MKIGLLTYNKSANYGAVLQCYATCRILKELGHEVEIINVEQDKYSRLHHLVFYFKDIAFAQFQRKFYAPKTGLFNNLKELKSASFNYDYLIVGSDQVWNPAISKDLCMAFFLNFGGSNVKRISYASSFGIKEWPNKYEHLTNEICKCLSSFSAVSVREFSGQQLLSNKFGIKSTLVVDPTILHDDYFEITGDIPENNHVISYLLNRNPEQLQKVVEFSKHLGEKPRMISTIYPYKGFKYVYPPSLEDWVRYIAGAKFVITDSFHGVVFSLLYRRNFIVITPENGINSRIKDLLSLVGIEDRYFNDNESIPYEKVKNSHLDYDKVHSILRAKREESINFLKENII